VNLIEARALYDAQRNLPERNFARDHSFGEWYEREIRPVASIHCDKSKPVARRDWKPPLRGGRHAKLVR
jgi:hypothetical protein